MDETVSIPSLCFLKILLRYLSEVSAPSGGCCCFWGPWCCWRGWRRGLGCWVSACAGTVLPVGAQRPCQGSIGPFPLPWTLGGCPALQSHPCSPLSFLKRGTSRCHRRTRASPRHRSRVRSRSVLRVKRMSPWSVGLLAEVFIPPTPGKPSRSRKDTLQ